MMLAVSQVMGRSSLGARGSGMVRNDRDGADGGGMIATGGLLRSSPASTFAPGKSGFTVCHPAHRPLLAWSVPTGVCLRMAAVLPLRTHQYGNLFPVIELRSRLCRSLNQMRSRFQRMSWSGHCIAKANRACDFLSTTIVNQTA